MCRLGRARREKDEGRDEKRRGGVRTEVVMKWDEGGWEVTLITETCDQWEETLITETCDLHTIKQYKTTDPLLRLAKETVRRDQN